MKLRTFIAVAAIGAAVAPAALAQSPPDPISGGTDVGGIVPSFLELSIIPPTASAGLASFPKAKTYNTSFGVQVTATDEVTVLTLADGDIASGSKMGHLA